LAIAAAALGTGSGHLPGAAAQETGQEAAVELTITETAGLRRFGYPVGAEVPLPRGEVMDTRHVVLEAAGQPVRSVQYDVLARWPDGSIQWLLVSFNLSPAPQEAQRFFLRYGPLITHPDPGKPVVAETEQAFTLRDVYRIPRHGDTFLDSVHYRPREFLRAPAFFELRGAGRNGSARVAELKVTAGQVIAAGPINAVVQLRGECNSGHAGSGGATPFTLTVASPNSKSWFDATLDVQNPLNQEVEVRLVVPYVVEKAPVRFDFGAGSWVYGTLRSGHQAVFKAARGGKWSLWTGAAGEETEFASATQHQPRAEGWAHLVDGALAGRAVGFGSTNFAAGERRQGVLWVSANGETGISWRLGKRERARLRGLFHHVFDPIHVSAVTSPPAMIFPLRVGVPEEWLARCQAGKTPNERP
jgi:hypothetical protein